jgi:hypothetical protein
MIVYAAKLSISPAVNKSLIRLEATVLAWAMRECARPEQVLRAANAIETLATELSDLKLTIFQSFDETAHDRLVNPAKL